MLALKAKPKMTIFFLELGGEKGEEGKSDRRRERGERKRREEEEKGSDKKNRHESQY